MAHFRYLFFIPILAQLVILSFPALAFRGGGADLSEATIRQMNHANMMHVAGTLSCELGDANNAQSCPLKIKDSKTGQTFELVKSSEAMRLYSSGNKNVTIEGTLDSDGEIEISKISSL